MGNEEWIAEDVPWYLIDKDRERPWRDEDVAMSAPIIIAKGTYLEAIDAMGKHMQKISEMNHVQRGGEGAMYRMAMGVFLAGSYVDPRYPKELGLRVEGRYYRVMRKP